MDIRKRRVIHIQNERSGIPCAKFDRSVHNLHPVVAIILKPGQSSFQEFLQLGGCGLHQHQYCNHRPVLSLYQLIGDSNQVNFESFKYIVKAQRNLEAICIFLLYTKNGYFMSLIDATAPLIDNITEVIWDIRFFIVVVMIQGFAFALSFFIIA